MEIKTSEIAQEKYNEIYNGSKKEIDAFLKDAEKNGVSWMNEDKIYQDNKFELYKRKCKNVYMIFSKGKNGELVILDFLTEGELLSWMK